MNLDSNFCDERERLMKGFWYQVSADEPYEFPVNANEDVSDAMDLFLKGEDIRIEWRDESFMVREFSEEAQANTLIETLGYPYMDGSVLIFTHDEDASAYEALGEFLYFYDEEVKRQVEEFYKDEEWQIVDNLENPLSIEA